MLVVFARINVKEPGAISIEENRTKLFLETSSCCSNAMSLPRPFCTASVGGRIGGVANRTKSAMRVMCSRVRTCSRGRELLPHSHRCMRAI